eukprot:g15246.t1
MMDASLLDGKGDAQPEKIEVKTTLVSEGKTRVAVIGAGVSGIAVARAMQQKGFPCTVYERGDKLGGIWGEYYPGYAPQVPKHMFRFPDMDYPRNRKLGRYVKGEDVRDYIEQYVDNFKMRDMFKLRTEVKSVRRSESGVWEVEVASSTDEGQVEFDFVVVCTGAYGTPDRHAELVKGKKVVTLGFGKSAHDVSQVVLQHGCASSDVVFRQPRWVVPQFILGLIPFDWPTFSRFGGLLYPPYYDEPSLLARVCNSVGYPLVWGVWRTVSLIFTLQFGYLWNGLWPKVPLENEIFGTGILDTHNSWFGALRSGKLRAHVASIRELSPGQVVLSNGTKLDAEVLVLGTGYEPSWKAFEAIFGSVEGKPEHEADGVWLYRQMISPALQGVAFIGATTTTFSNILAYSIQARWLAELLAGTFQLPSEQQMRQDVEKQKAWKRSFMPFSGERAIHIQTHQVHYYDQLIKDFRGRKQRKSNPLAEFFLPYHPRDYAGIVDPSQEPACCSPLSWLVMLLFLPIALGLGAALGPLLLVVFLLIYVISAPCRCCKPKAFLKKPDEAPAVTDAEPPSSPST